MRKRNGHLAIFVDQTPRQRQDSIWEPPADVFRTRYGWLLKFELAGVQPEDVTIEVSERAITITGIRRDLYLEESIGFHSMEIHYNRFRRTIELPCKLEAVNTQWELRDGLLLLRIQMKEDCHE